MKRKVIIAGLKTATAAASKGKNPKGATQPVMGALKGLLQQTLESNQTLEADVDHAAESLENMEYALENENWQLTAAGAKSVSSTVKEYQRAQKTAAKVVANLRKLGAKAQAELEKSRIKDEPEVSENAEDEAEEE